jgi:hypothetical protein
MTSTSSLPSRPSVLADIYAGAVRGDFAPTLGVAGIVTQIIVGFLPGIGTICAARDFIADRRNHDRLGTLLNALALIPFLGGFPKTAAVLHSVHHIGRVVYKMEHQRSPTSSPVS